MVPGSGQLHNGLHAQAKRRTRDIFRGRERELSDDNWQTDGRALGRGETWNGNKEVTLSLVGSSKQIIVKKFQ